MKESELQSLRDGLAVMHVDGTRGVVRREPGYRDTITIQWADGESLAMKTDRREEIEWAMTDLYHAAD